MRTPRKSQFPRAVLFVPTGNSRRLMVSCDSADNRSDKRSLRIDPVRDARTLPLSLLKIVETSEKSQFPRAVPIPSGGMVTILFALVPLLSFRFRSRASLEHELVALRHQVIVLRRQRPHRLRLLPTGSCGCCFTDCGRRFSKPWYSSNPRP